MNKSSDTLEHQLGVEQKRLLIKKRKYKVRRDDRTYRELVEQASKVYKMYQQIMRLRLN